MERLVFLVIKNSQTAVYQSMSVFGWNDEYNYDDSDNNGNTDLTFFDNNKKLPCQDVKRWSVSELLCVHCVGQITMSLLSLTLVNKT